LENNVKKPVAENPGVLIAVSKPFRALLGKIDEKRRSSSAKARALFKTTIFFLYYSNIY